MISSPVVADAISDAELDAYNYCSPFDDKCNGRDRNEYFGDDNEPKKDRVKSYKPQKAIQYDDPWSNKSRKSSLGDIQGRQLQAR